MSPESLLNSQYSYKSDVYSFGITMWEIFTMCSEPYKGLSRIQAAMAVLEKDKRPKLWTTYYQNTILLDLIESCWARDSNNRPMMKTVTQSLSRIKALRK